MKGFHEVDFNYPGFAEEGWCEVAVYWDLKGTSLVLIRDHQDHGSTAVADALETVCRLIQTQVLEPLGCPLKNIMVSCTCHNTLWVHWSAAERVYSKVGFVDPMRFVGPNRTQISQPWLDELTRQYGMGTLVQVGAGD